MFNCRLKGEGIVLKKRLPALISLILLMQVLSVFRASANGTTIGVNLLEYNIALGKTLSVDINVTNIYFLTSWQFTLYFLKSVLNCTSVTEGPFLKTGGGTYFGKTINNNYNATHGSVVAYDSLLGMTYVNGSGTVVTLTFNTTGAGDTTLHLTDTKLGDQNIPPQNIPHTVIDGTAHVQNFTLTVSTVGSGTVTLNNTGPYYASGEKVELTANPLVGWSFQGWSGDLGGSTNPATLTISGNMSVTATFTQDQYALTINIVGSGTVDKNPNQATYTWGTNVTLTAYANLGWTFAGWSGGATGTTNPTVVNMTGSKTVTATFTQNQYTLTVNTVGQGSVGRNNTGPYHYGDVVQLSATPTIGWSFDHWSGDLTGSTNPDTIVVDANKTVTATFTENTYTLTVNIDPIGSGSVNSNTTPPYHYGDAVQLTAFPTAGWTFDHWTGDLQVLPILQH